MAAGDGHVMPLRLSARAVVGNPFLIRRALVLLRANEDFVFRYGVGASLWFL